MEQPKEVTPGQAVSKDELIFWRHVGKGFGMVVNAWLSPGALSYACQYKSQRDPDQEVQGIVEYLMNSGVEPELWTMARFQSEVCFVLFYFMEA